eukprot:scaffold501141_cov48-Prasinocladus_malaysianus.AAC.2
MYVRQRYSYSDWMPSPVQACSIGSTTVRVAVRVLVATSDYVLSRSGCLVCKLNIIMFDWQLFCVTISWIPISDKDAAADTMSSMNTYRICRDKDAQEYAFPGGETK